MSEVLYGIREQVALNQGDNDIYEQKIIDNRIVS